MYNRYIPQADGSYRRSRIPDNAPPPAPVRRHAPPVQQEAPCPPPEAENTVTHQQEPCRQGNPRQNCPRQGNCPPKQRTHPPKQESNPEPGSSIGGFLRQLLPRDFDTGDLLVVILLLLMAGDSGDDQNIALLTLALYLFM